MLVFIAALVFSSPMVITQSGHVLLPAQPRPSRDLDTPALIVRGDNLTVDFGGSTLKGSDATVWPDQRQGLGLRIEGNNVTIKNLNVRGYKIGLLARNCRNLKILNGDFSYNWKQRLASTPEREDSSDWMSFHHNENREWMRYGGGIYLESCPAFEVQGTRITGGQSGLLLTKCDGGKVWNCDFSFNSALGIGMYRSSKNQVMHNRLDYNVRGFSYGVYNRGQDSAGILVFEQCHKNVFAYNSVTHGGDGFFLWAGQHTMDTGEGGCNGNLLEGNDFSYAPTNGIEATFSSNVFLRNRVHGCWHGVWGGYSYQSIFHGNDFADNQRGIAIEHGFQNSFTGNRFQGDDVAIALWAPPVDPNFAYAKVKETRSMGNLISGNRFKNHGLVLDVRDTTETDLLGNQFDEFQVLTRVPAGQKPFILQNPDMGQDSAIDPAQVRARGASRVSKPLNDYHAISELPRMTGGMDALKSVRPFAGWSTIFVDEWGPYDFRRPLITLNVEPSGPAPQPGGTSAGSGFLKAKPRTESKRVRYNLWGPQGEWRVVSVAGVRLDSNEGKVPGSVQGTLTSGLVKIDLEYVGAKTTDVRGIETPAGQRIAFGYEKFSPEFNWDVKFFGWQESENPSDVHANPRDFDAVLRSTPIQQVKVKQLDFAGYAMALGLPTNHYATLAEGTVTVPKGEYLLDLLCDDGARLWLDGKLLIADAWKYQGPTLYSRKVRLSGTHRLRVEHFQIDGYATLKVGLRRSP